MTAPMRRSFTPADQRPASLALDLMLALEDDPAVGTHTRRVARRLEHEIIAAADAPEVRPARPLVDRARRLSGFARPWWLGWRP